MCCGACDEKQSDGSHRDIAGSNPAGGIFILIPEKIDNVKVSIFIFSKGNSNHFSKALRKGSLFSCLVF